MIFTRIVRGPDGSNTGMLRPVILKILPICCEATRFQMAASTVAEDDKMDAASKLGQVLFRRGNPRSNKKT